MKQWSRSKSRLSRPLSAFSATPPNSSMCFVHSAVRKTRHILIALALLLMSAPEWSQAAAQTARSEPILRPFTIFTLDNGLTVLVREDHKLPIASVTVIYNVGSHDDPPGRAGMAHLF